MPEIKLSDSEPGAFYGYCSTFNDAPDSYGDVVDPSAFDQTLAEHRRNGTLPHMLIQHGQGDTVECGLPVGVWDTFKKDSKGLRVEGRLAKTRRGEDVLTLVRMGAIRGLSIGYRARKAVYMPKGSPVK